jgi:gluconolactonase
MGRARPLQRHFRLPFAISIEQQRTDREPCLGLLVALSASAGPRILSSSLILGFPYADVEEMGSSLIVVSDSDEDAAQVLLQSVAALAMSRLAAFDGEKKSISEWIGGLGHVPGPVLMLDMGDNVGGGSPGDSTHLLDHLDDAGVRGAFICIHDPAAVAAAAKHGSDGYFPLSFGRDPVNGHVRVRMVRKIFSGDGAFTEDKPRHGGQVRFDMGAIAIVGTEQGQTVMLTTLRTAPFSLRQLTAFGLDPARFSSIVAKGVNAPIAAYRDVCPTIWQVDTPGVTQADMTRFQFRHRRKPLFPFEVPMMVAASVVAERALVRLASLDHYTEGPAFDASGNIYFTTLTGGGIMRLTPDGLLSEWARTDCPNGQIILPDGDHLVCDSRRGRLLRIPPDGRSVMFASSEEYHSGHSLVPNDLVMDACGYVYFTDSVRHVGCICCVGPEGRQWHLAAGLDYPNGIALSPDGGWLYVAESYRNRILRYRLRAPGVVDGGYEVFAELPSHPSGDPISNLPDGIAFNAAGQLAVAHYGMQQVQLLTPEGRLLGSYDSGMPCTSNVFFTDDQTLLVTGGYGEPGPGAVFLMRLPGG